MTLARFYAEETGLILSAADNNEEGSTACELEFTVVDEERAECHCELSSKLRVAECKHDMFYETADKSYLRHFRSVLKERDTITLSFPKKIHTAQKVYLNSAYVFYLGDGAFSVFAHEDIQISKRRSRVKGEGKLPPTLIPMLDELEYVEPQDIEEVGLVINQSMFIKEKLMSYSHERLSKQDNARVDEAIPRINAIINHLNATKRRLKKQPVFGALEKTLLLDKLESYLADNGMGEVFASLQIEARKEAMRLSSSDPVSCAQALWRQVESHDLHQGLKRFFEHNAPPQITIVNCDDCGGRGRLNKSFHPQTKKKRFEVSCSKCGKKAKTSFSNTASGAVVNWSTANDLSTLDWPDFSVFDALSPSQREHAEFSRSLDAYINLYQEYVTARLKSVDSDKRSGLLAIQGKLQYLRDARVMLMRVLKHKKRHYDGGN